MYRHLYSLAICIIAFSIACADPSCPAGYMLYGDQCRRCKPGEEREHGQCVSVLDASTESVVELDAHTPIDDVEPTPDSTFMTDNEHNPDASVKDSGSVSECGSGGDCVPSLSGLALSAGTLLPALRADTTEGYLVKLGLSTQTVTLVPSVQPGLQISVNDDVIESGQRWTSETLALGGNRVSIVVSNSTGDSRTYTLNIVRGYEGAFIKASNTDAADAFGTAVAISGNTLVVGAPGEDSSATRVNGLDTDNGASRAGAAYVFERIGDSWKQQAYLKPSQLAVDDEFGQNVAIDGDTIAVASPGFNRPLAPGAVYIFQRQQGSWSQRASITAPNTAVFGASVSISGDVLVVGATREGLAGGNGSFDGAAYVFARTGDSWAQQARLTPAPTQPGSLFGASVAVSGNTVAIGAHFDGSGATGVNGDPATGSAPGSGAVYIFARGERGWSQEAYIKAINTGADDHFGADVALSGDTLVVGAPYEDSASVSSPDEGAPDSGATYVFTRDTGATWTQQAYLKASNPGPSDQFGSAVSVAGNLLVVGSLHEGSAATGISEGQRDDTASDAGAAYCFARKDGTWHQEAYLKGSNTAAGDRFGTSVAVSEDAIAVGAPGEDSSATGTFSDTGPNDSAAASSGAVYVFPY